MALGLQEPAGMVREQIRCRGYRPFDVTIQSTGKTLTDSGYYIEKVLLSPSELLGKVFMQ